MFVQNAADPPDDIDSLKAALLAARAEVFAAQSALEAGAVEIEHLQASLKQLLRKAFGPSSEKLDRAIEQLELRLEDLEETQVSAKSTRTRRPSSPARSVRCVSQDPGSPSRIICHVKSWCLSRRRPARAVNRAQE